LITRRVVVATPDGLLRFNRDREEFKLYQSVMACPPVPSSASSKITRETSGWEPKVVIPVQPNHEDFHQLL
jgi:hypothetical protein